MTTGRIPCAFTDLVSCWHVSALGIHEPDWAAIRNYCDGLLSNPDMATAELNNPPVASGSPFFDAFLAALAETLADKLDIAHPDWTATRTALPEAWEMPGTPSMRAARYRATPLAFLDRRIVVDRDSLWHVREHGA